MTHIKPQEIEALLEAFDNSPWQEMRLKVEGLELFLSKTPGATAHSEPVDLAPTLSSILGINAPSSSIGRVLTEALQPTGERP